jgi:hemoglobin
MTKLAVLACILIACGGPAKPPAESPAASAAPPGSRTGAAPAPAAAPNRAGRSLYDRLGGKPAIAAVTGELIDRIAADARIKYRFLNTDLGKLKALLVDFVCAATGGPCKYTGQDMETSHAGMELVDDEFTALVEDLAGALDKFKVPAREKSELLGALAPLQPAIVTPAGRLKPVDDAAIARATAVAVRLGDENAIELMQAAIVAARRGQRNYADLLFSHVEAVVGPAAVAAAAPTFRDGAPPRLETPLRRMARDTPPQPRLAGGSDDDGGELDPRRPASLTGTLTVAGQPLDGLGTVMLFPVKGGGKPRRPKLRVVEQRDKTFAPTCSPSRRAPPSRSPTSTASTTTCSRSRRPRSSTSGCTRTARLASSSSRSRASCGSAATSTRRCRPTSSWSTRRTTWSSTAPGSSRSRAWRPAATRSARGASAARSRPSPRS